MNRRFFAFLTIFAAMALSAFQRAPDGRDRADTACKQIAKPKNDSTRSAPVKPAPKVTPADQGHGKGGEEGSAPTLRKYCGTLRVYSADRSVLQLAGTTGEADTTAGKEACDKAPATAIQIQVEGQALKDELASWKAGDRIIATVAVSKKDAVETARLQDVQPQVFRIGGELRLLVFVLPVVVLFLALVSKHVRDLFFAGQDGRMSNSKTQMSLWFTLWISAYVTAFVLRWTSAGGFLGAIGTPANLLALSGLSGLTAAGAMGITANKIANKPPKNPDGTPKGKWTNEEQPTRIEDLIQDDNQKFDLGDFQMLVMTLIAVVSYAIILYNFLGALPARATISLPDVDGTVLAMFGVGQGAYLTKKATTGIEK